MPSTEVAVPAPRAPFESLQSAIPSLLLPIPSKHVILLLDSAQGCTAGPWPDRAACSESTVRGTAALPFPPCLSHLQQPTWRAALPLTPSCLALWQHSLAATGLWNSSFFVFASLMCCDTGEEKESGGCASAGESCAGCPVHSGGSVSQQQCRSHVQFHSNVWVSQGHIKNKEKTRSCCTLVQTSLFGTLNAAMCRQESQGPGEDSAPHVEPPLLLPPIPFLLPTQAAEGRGAVSSHLHSPWILSFLWQWECAGHMPQHAGHNYL